MSPASAKKPPRKSQSVLKEVLLPNAPSKEQSGAVLGLEARLEDPKRMARAVAAYRKIVLADRETALAALKRIGAPIGKAAKR